MSCIYLHQNIQLLHGLPWATRVHLLVSSPQAGSMASTDSKNCSPQQPTDMNVKEEGRKKEVMNKKPLVSPWREALNERKYQTNDIRRLLSTPERMKTMKGAARHTATASAPSRLKKGIVSVPNLHILQPTKAPKYYSTILVTLLCTALWHCMKLAHILERLVRRYRRY